MMKLFNRNVEVTFEGADINPVTKLRVAFDVSKQDGVQFNVGTIRIYNLNSSSRGALARIIQSQDDPCIGEHIKCTLRVGYGDQLIHLITGDILFASNQRVGPDWITDIEIYTGRCAAIKSDLQISYGKKTSAKKIANDLLATIKNVDIQYTQEAEKALQNKSVLSYSMSGIAYNEAAVFLSRYDLKFTIEEEGSLLVYKKGEPRDLTSSQTELNTFKPENGLVGSPKVTRSGVEFQSLLRPQVKILQRVYVESQSVNETLQNQDRFSNEYFVTGLKHTGDTHSDEWFTEIEGAYVELNKGFLP